MKKNVPGTVKLVVSNTAIRPQEPMVVTSVNIPVSTRDNAKDMAKWLNTTVSDIATVALNSIYQDFARRYPKAVQTTSPIEAQA